MVYSFLVKNTHLNIPWLHVAEQWNENIVSLFGEGGRLNDEDFFLDDEVLLLLLLLLLFSSLLVLVFVISFVVSAFVVVAKEEEEDLFFAKDMRMRWLRGFWRIRIDVFCRQNCKKKKKKKNRHTHKKKVRIALLSRLSHHELCFTRAIDRQRDLDRQSLGEY